MLMAKKIVDFAIADRHAIFSFSASDDRRSRSDRENIILIGDHSRFDLFIVEPEKSSNFILRANNGDEILILLMHLLS